MFLVADSVKELSGSIALMALLAVAYGAVARMTGRAVPARMILGLLFGAASMLTMADRTEVAPGVFADLRHLPIALAGGFLGWEGAAVAMAMALATRLGIGGAGGLTGAVGILIAGSAGLIWERWTRDAPVRGPGAMLGLALLTSTYAVATVLLPAPVARDMLAAVVPVLLPLHVLGVFAVGTLIERERALHRRENLLLRDADHDSLTGLLNRRGFERAVAGLDGGRAGTLLLLDLDHFKRVNDTHGHPAGDAVLRATGERVSSHLSRRDLVARLGGEELAVFLPGQTSQDARTTARQLCEAIRAEGFSLPSGGTVVVTTSVGGAWGSSASLDRLMARADSALYAAKHAGRDRCRFAPELSVLDKVPALAAESVCSDCTLHALCCRDREEAARQPLGPAGQAVA